MGDYVYVAESIGGIRVLYGLNNYGVFETQGVASGVATSTLFCYATCGDAGLYIINVSNPHSPYMVGYYNTSGDARRVTVYETIAYVADGNNLGIYDCTDALGITKDINPLVPTNARFVSIHPNPFNNVLTISVKVTKIQEVKVEIINLSGKFVKLLTSGSLGVGVHSFTWYSDLSGIYFVIVQSSSDRAVHKVIRLK